MVSAIRGQFNRLVCVFLLACVLIVAYAPASSLAYRKPPFNGSIFGKRADPESATRTLAAMCEVAAEACTAWFPGSSSENN